MRSFVRRAGRITKAQQRALERLLPRYAVELGATVLDLEGVFGAGPVVLDIGFGDGEALAALALAHPDIHYLGVEVYEPGIGHLLLKLVADDLTNVRIVRADAAEVLSNHLGADCLAAVNLFFPDPWPKKRHFKRRLVQTPFVRDVVRVLRPNGVFHVATDWRPYAEHVQRVLAEFPQLRAAAATDVGHGPLAQRPSTKFEHRGRALGHEVTDLYYLKR